MVASSSGSKRGKKKSTTHRDLRTGLSIQSTVRSDGRTWILRRKPGGGKIISKAEYEELLKKNPVVAVLPDARQEQTANDDQDAASANAAMLTNGREILDAVTGIGSESISGDAQPNRNISDTQIGEDIDPAMISGNRVASSDRPQQQDGNSLEKTTSAKDNGEPPLGDFISGALKGELPLLHEFLEINVELLKQRRQNAEAHETASNETTNGGGPDNGHTEAHNTGPGSVSQKGGTAAGAGGVAVNGDVHGGIHVSPPDPEKEGKEDYKKKVLRDADLRHKIEETARAESDAGRRPYFIDSDLSDRLLHKINLPNTDFNEAKLRNCKLIGAVLENADFRGADLSGADLSGAILIRADFSGGKTNLTGVTMKGQRTQCAYANFDSALLDKIQIENADLHGATVRNAKLRGAQLKDVTMKRADLSGSDLSGATLNNINLEGTILEDVTIDDDVVADKECRAILEVACLTDPNPVAVKGASFRGTILRGAHLAGYDLTGSDFSQSDLTLAKLGKANLTGVSLVQTNLERANLHGATLRKAKLNNAYLGGTILSHADFEGADLTGVNLKGADLRGAKISDEQLSVARDLSGAIMPDGSIHP
jgi:uncharacterized protein YjbI with pentapeptide repeats